MADVGEFEVEASGLESRAQGLILNPACLPPVSAGEETSPLRKVGQLGN